MWDGRGAVLDVCTGPARIPIELCRWRAEADTITNGRVTQMFGSLHITAVDLADHMLVLAQRNVEAAGFGHCIALAKADAKRLPFPDESFGAVLCNGSVHHIPGPSDCFAEMHRVCASGCTIFVRDLLAAGRASRLSKPFVKTHARGE